jgi:hypothetical protein
MPTPNIEPELRRLIETIATRQTFHGQRVSPTIMKMMEIEIRANGGGVLAPYWLSVLQTGRPPRKNNVDHHLWRAIYAWMDKRGLFRSGTAKGKINEAKSMTWYINKYGNLHFRSKTYIDIYETARNDCVNAVLKKYGDLEYSITKQIL